MTPALHHYLQSSEDIGLKLLKDMDPGWAALNLQTHSEAPRHTASWPEGFPHLGLLVQSCMESHFSKLGWLLSNPSPFHQLHSLG